MRKPVRVWVAGAASLLFTYLFFYNYLPPVKRAYIPYDLHGYHHPLTDYAFQALREGRFPQWDATTYCGISFVGNVQSALFYPPTWLLFAANMGRRAVSYQSMEDFMFAHVWVAFLLCFLWLRYKRLSDMACVLGAGIFAFSGYACEQLQHLGLVAGYAWMPLGLWGIDQAVEERRWQPLWKVTAASTLCFLAGYVPTWVVFAVCLLTYAGWRWKALMGTGAALAASLVLAMVQLLPTLEITGLKLHEDRYGSGIEPMTYLIAHLVPNYLNFNMHYNGGPADQYLYLGAPAVLGLLWLLRSGRWRPALPLLAMLAVVLLFATNPRNRVWEVLRHSNMAAEVFRDWYFLAGIPLAVAALAALGLDSALRRPRRAAPVWLAWLSVALLAVWAGRELVLRSRGQLATGWASAWDAAAALLLCGFAIYLLPGTGGRLRTVLAAALLLLVATEYHVFGTSRRFNGTDNGNFPDYGSGELYAMDQPVYDQLRANSQYRIGLDVTGPFPTELRHYGLTTPQGFDPFLTVQYAAVVKRIGKFRSDREFDLNPDDVNGLRSVGVRYFVTAEVAPLFPRIAQSPHFRRMPPGESFYRVYEFTGARPPYGWLEDGPGRTVRLTGSSPEWRVFQVSSPTGGRFGLVEQFFPGWEAWVDGAPARIERWQEAFQSTWVPAGEHRVEFRYNSPGFRAGAVISLLALLAAAAVILLQVRAHKRDRLGSGGHP